MKFSTKGRYAIRLITELYNHSDKGPIRLRELAINQDISEKYAEQIFSIMRRGGLIKATRGTLGGYELAKKANEITIGMILRLTEGDLAPIPCLERNENGCSRQQNCASLKFWKLLSVAILNVVDNITIKDLASFGDISSCKYEELLTSIPPIKQNCPKEK